ncbi:hypothetical protein, partial [Hydrogenophaga sp.]|uniref:hypothetical protein n=1 Tax=Hydrogenophaga sp. TaxID=1904254 RepID=UPI00356869C6
MKTLLRQHEHETVLGAPRDIQGDQAPLLLQRSDGDFIEAVLDELKTSDGRRRLKQSRASASNASGVLKLFQPVQRQHHVAVLEAWCDTPGEVRIDPSRVASAGLVVRRVRTNGRAVLQGWMRSKGRLRGWIPVARMDGHSGDPVSSLRLARGKTGVADIDRELGLMALQNEDALLNEHVVPMFIAPPEVCQAAGKTLYYGVVPTVSGELAETPEAFDETGAFGPESADFKNHLVQALRGERMDFPLAGETLDADWFEAAEMATTDKPAGVSNAHWNLLKPDGSARSAMQRFIRLLRQLGNEFDAFDGSDPAFQALRDELARIPLPMVLRTGETQARTTPASVFLRQAARVLLERDGSAPRPEMPSHWPLLGSDQARRLRQLLSQAVGQRFAQVNPAPGRFEEAQAQYVVRCFLRLKP